MSATAAIMAGIGVAGSLGGAAIQGHAAGNAANAQVNAANYAANLQAQEAQQALDFQKQQFATTQANIAPWLQSGGNALQALDYGLGIPGYNPQTNALASNNGIGNAASRITPTTTGPGSIGGMMGAPNPRMLSANTGQGAQGSYAIMGANGGRLIGPAGRVPPANTGTSIGGANVPPVNNPSLTGGSNLLAPSGYGAFTQPWTQQFTPPNNVTEQNDPGYQFRLNQGEQALQRSAAAQGNLLTGNTARDIQNYGQDYASNEYNNVYNRALGQYQQNYNIFNNNQANAYNRLASLAGLGQVSANQLGQFGQNAASNVGNILLTTGAQQGQNALNAGSARASGYIGGANALSGGLAGVGSSITNAILLNQLLKNQSTGSLGNDILDTNGM